MWGSFVSDENTIPSLSSDLNHDFQPVNVGENLYVSGQSLNRLIENIDNINEGDHVVFFDGVNDSFVNCQSVNGPNGHSQVKQIRRLISNEKNFFKSLYIRGLNKFRSTNTFTVLNGIGKRIGLSDLKEIDDEVVFLRKIIDGGTDKSYGIYVAKMAGLPNEVILRANEILESLSANGGQTVNIKEYNSEKLKESSQRDIEKEIISELKNIDINSMSPIEALKKLDQLKIKYEI